MRLAYLTIGLTVLATAAPAMAQTEDDRARARAEFGRGVELFEAQDYREALAAFQEAYRLAPHPSVRVNMANCYEQLDQPLEAMFHYERFLAEAQGISGAQRTEVRAALEELRSRTSEVTLRIAPDGAIVVIDGAETRRAPIQTPVRLAEGDHTVEVRLDGYETVTREFAVPGGSPMELAIRLTRGAPTPVEPVTPPTEPTGPEPAGPAEPESAESLGSHDAAPEGAADIDGSARVDVAPSAGGLRLTTPVIVAGAVTGALLLGTIITGSLALGADSEFDDAVRDSNNPALPPAQREAARRDGLDALDRADTLALVTDILLVGTLVGAGATAYFLFTSDDGGDRMARLRISPTASAAGAGLIVSGEL